MKRFSGLCVLVAMALGVSACGGGRRTDDGGRTRSPRTAVSAGTITSSGLILGGRVRCTATMSTRVEAGHEVDLTFSLRNISGSAVKAPVTEGSLWLVVKTGDGTTYDTRTALSAEGSLGGPYRTPVTIRPGAAATMAGHGPTVRWAGPLQVTPGCEDEALPPLRVSVVAPGPPPDDQTAIADVVAASGGLLDKCRPQRSDVPVQGELDAPGGAAPPMEATCSVSIHSEGRFLVAQALVLTPPNMRGVEVRQPYEVVSLPKVPRPYEAIAWEFVVTKDGAVTVAGMTRDATKVGDNMAPGWDWTGSRWNGPDKARCGYEGLSGGPTIDFISACPY